MREEGIGERLQTLLAGDLGAGAALRLVGEVEILQLLLAGGGADGGLQLVGQLALLADALQDGVAALGQLQEVLAALEEGLELQIFQAAGGLLAVTGDEGHGGALGEQRSGGFDLARPAADLRGDDLHETGFQDGGLAHWGSLLESDGVSYLRADAGRLPTVLDSPIEEKEMKTVPLTPEAIPEIETAIKARRPLTLALKGKPVATVQPIVSVTPEEAA